MAENKWVLSLGDLRIMVINDLLNGMILQVGLTMNLPASVQKTSPSFAASQNQRCLFNKKCTTIDVWNKRGTDRGKSTS